MHETLGGHLDTDHSWVGGWRLLSGESLSRYWRKGRCCSRRGPARQNYLLLTPGAWRSPACSHQLSALELYLSPPDLCSVPLLLPQFLHPITWRNPLHIHLPRICLKTNPVFGIKSQGSSRPTSWASGPPEPSVLLYGEGVMHGTPVYHLCEVRVTWGCGVTMALACCYSHRTRSVL